MDSLIPQLLIQIPVLALIGFAAFLFRGFQRERQILSNAIRDYEARIETLSGSSKGEDLGKISVALEEMRQELSDALAKVDETTKQTVKMKEHMTNQKTALKEFGRVLSRTSEQTYGELQGLETRIERIQSALVHNGMHVEMESDVA